MNKIAILTVVDYNNYGNRLQNYALQKVLESNGFEVKTLKNSFVKAHNGKDKMKVAIKSNRLLVKFRNLFGSHESLQRAENFAEFTKNYIKETDFDIANKNMSVEMLSEFDSVVVGSDQIWNYELLRFSELNFFPFKQHGQKLISYAASFGLETIPQEEVIMYRNGLKNFNYITVREVAGLKIVKQILNKDAKVVLDPTMLISKEEWSEIAEKSELNTDYDYLVTYFLGKPSKEQNEYIQTYAKINNLKIRKFNDVSDPECYKLGPIGFIKLIRDSKAVFADSFHAAVFSIIFEKYFKVFSRNSNHQTMISRIDTLLSFFDLKKQKYQISDLEYEEIDYKRVTHILSQLKLDSIEYLLEMLKDE